MAETPIKVEAPPLPTPTGGASATASQMADEFMADLTGATPPAPAATPPEPPKEPVTPAEPPKAAPAPPKPAAAAPPKPAAQPAPAKPVVKLNIDDLKVSASDLRRHLKEIIADKDKTVGEKQKEIATLQDKIKEFEGKKFWTDDDQKLSEQATKRLAKLESDLYGRDYRQSPEFKTQFQDKFDRLWSKGVETVKGLTVTWKEGDEDKSRPATQQDLLRVVDAPASERYKLAKQLFGEDYPVVIDYANKLNDIRESAEEAVKNKQDNHQSETQKQADELKKVSGQIEQFVKEAGENLVQKFPDIFSAKEDEPEVAAALKKGFDFVDDARINQGKFNPNERAAKIAVIRSWAGAFPRLIHDRSRLMAENAALREEIAKYNKTDPGNLGEGAGAGGGAGKDDGGSDELAAEFSKMGA
jgi:predicted nuclease with TOPRIM domain